MKQLLAVMLLVLATGAFAQDHSFVENGILYRSSSAKAVSQVAVFRDVGRIIDQKPAAQKLLYLAASRTPNNDAVSGSNLMLVDTKTWSNRLVATSVITANLSPDGTMAVLWRSGHKVTLVRSDGSLLQQIGTHGAAPVFSHDGNFIAYQKLADSSSDGSLQGLFEEAQGISVYDVRTGRENLVTSSGTDDFAPVGFSLDLNKLYFNSTRPYERSSHNHVASLWVVDLKNGEKQRLTNLDEAAVRRGAVTPIPNETALWSSDRTAIVFSNGREEGVWKFALSSDGRLSNATRIADGESPQWVIPDETIAIRTISNGKSAWRILSVR